MDVSLIVESELRNKGLVIVPLTATVMRDRLAEVSDFVNEIRREGSQNYGWSQESDEYLLNPMVRKWELSYAFEVRESGGLTLVALSSMYESTVHLHCVYVKLEWRGNDLAILHNLLLCQRGVNLGYETMEGYWPKQNSGSIALYLRMGWNIQDLRKQGSQVFMTASVQHSIDATLKLLRSRRRPSP